MTRLMVTSAQPQIAAAGKMGPCPQPYIKNSQSQVSGWPVGIAENVRNAQGANVEPAASTCTARSLPMDVEIACCIHDRRFLRSMLLETGPAR